MTTTSVTLSVQIACPAAEAYRFIADPATMPQWAIHNVKSIRPLGQKEWEIQTPRGAGRLIPHYDQQSGILDHEFVDGHSVRYVQTGRTEPFGVRHGTRAHHHDGCRENVVTDVNPKEPVFEGDIRDIL